MFSGASNASLANGESCEENCMHGHTAQWSSRIVMENKNTAGFCAFQPLKSWVTEDERTGHGL